jgi:hypothetical protein
MRNIDFSKVKRAHGFLRYLWPVQSWDQIKLMALLYAVGLPVVALVVYLNDVTAMAWAVIGAALGGTLPLYMALPATLELTTQRGEARHHVAELATLLRRLGYADGERRGPNLHFASRPSWFRRWLPRFVWWKEIDIALSVQERTITLRGPTFILNIVKRHGERGTLQGAFRF